MGWYENIRRTIQKHGTFFEMIIRHANKYHLLSCTGTLEAYLNLDDKPIAERTERELELNKQHTEHHIRLYYALQCL